MATLANLRRAASKLGATVEDHSGLKKAEYQVAAPSGKVWACSGDIHWIVLSWWSDNRGRPVFPQEKTSAIEDAIERMSHGLADCMDDECDVCNE